MDEREGLLGLVHASDCVYCVNRNVPASESSSYWLLAVWGIIHDEIKLTLISIIYTTAAKAEDIYIYTWNVNVAEVPQ